ncbi:hypothetical protein IEQ34_012824 [Dendrobium chrysotoxum]|uniref:Uncharacterized protein n=1 Tax=Dendrobium chrysotoxum TaxID=161865 RepID=A0AAV7GPA4_DENCH|nr:hypothetical protein IEQ34_012824 [Dendrobium chrysotoxum]
MITVNKVMMMAAQLYPTFVYSCIRLHVLYFILQYLNADKELETKKSPSCLLLPCFPLPKWRQNRMILCVQFMHQAKAFRFFPEDPPSPTAFLAFSFHISTFILISNPLSPFPITISKHLANSSEPTRPFSPTSAFTAVPHSLSIKHAFVT